MPFHINKKKSHWSVFLDYISKYLEEKRTHKRLYYSLFEQALLTEMCLFTKYANNIFRKDFLKYDNINSGKLQLIFFCFSLPFSPIISCGCFFLFFLFAEFTCFNFCKPYSFPYFELLQIINFSVTIWKFFFYCREMLQ